MFEIFRKLFETKISIRELSVWERELGGNLVQCLFSEVIIVCALVVVHFGKILGFMMTCLSDVQCSKARWQRKLVGYEMQGTLQCRILAYWKVGGWHVSWWHRPRRHKWVRVWPKKRRRWESGEGVLDLWVFIFKL